MKLTGKVVRVEVNNNTYEAGITHLFKDAIEKDIIQNGGIITEVGENLKIYVDIIELKTIPVTFDKKYIANSYNLIVKTNIKFFSVDANGEKMLKEISISPIYNYNVKKDITDTEIERQLSLDKAVFEISSIILNNLIAMP